MINAPHILRATQLMQLNRHAAAELELRQALLADPNLAQAHSLLALCFLEREAFDEAQREAEAAVGVEPDNSFAHYVLGRVWYKRKYLDRAADSLDEAIRLAPDDADYHGFRGAIYFERSQWQLALNEAEIGLQFDAENAQCNNLRAMALVKLGRRAEAGATIDSHLAREPEDSYAHANKGWTLLEARQPKEALHHFREALRLDPTNQWARAGIVEGLKARNPIYGLFLRYLLWMAKLPPRAQWGVIIGGYFGSNMLSKWGAANPEWSWVVLPLTLAYLAFVFLTWFAAPIFNLLLLLHPLGKHALNESQAREAKLIGGCLAAAVGCLTASQFIGETKSAVILLLAGLYFLAVCLPLHLLFMCSPGWPKQTMVAITGGMILLSLVSIGSFAIDLVGVGAAAARYMYWAVLGTMLGGQVIAQAEPKR